MLARDIAHEASCVLMWKRWSKINAIVMCRCVRRWRTVSHSEIVNVIQDQAMDRSKLLMMKRVLGVLRNKAIYYALHDWECNLQDDNQDMLFRAMRSETAVRVVEAYTRRHREVCYMKMLTRMQERQLNQHNIENACAPLKAQVRALKADLKIFQHKVNMNDKFNDLTLEKAMGWGHAFEMIEDCLGVSKKVLTAMIGAWSRAALMQGMYAARDNRLAVVDSEIKRSTLLFRKCKQATKAVQDTKHQLRVARAAMYLIVWQLTDRQLMCIQAARLVAQWRHGFWDDIATMSLHATMPQWSVDNL